MGFHRRTINIDILRTVYKNEGVDGIDRLINGRYDVLSINDAQSMEIYHIFQSHFDSDAFKCQLIRNILTV